MESDEALDRRLYSPYGPVRLTAQAWAQPASRLAVSGHIDAQTGKMTKAYADFMARDVMLHMLEAVRPLAQTDPGLAAAMQSEIFKLKSWIFAWGMYCACGRELFEFSPGLVEALKHTDVGETKLDGLRLPFQSFYIRFGPQPDLSYDYEDQQAYADGAFFSFQVDPSDPDTGSLIICITMALASGQGFLTPGPEFTIKGADFHVPVDQAIESAAQYAISRADELHEMLMTNPNGPAAHMAEGIKVTVDESAAMVRRAMPLLVNALYYLSDLPRGKARAGSDTPEILKEKFDRAASPKAANKLRSNFLSEGYAIVRLCGEEFERQEDGGASGAGRSAHWRRGHWRDQRYGAQHALTKRIWIRPVRVNPDHPDPDTPGHLYKVT